MKHLVIASLAALTIVGCATDKEAMQSSQRALGASSSVGHGTVTSYADFDGTGAPKAIGVIFQASALEGLPASGSDGHHCFDRNKDGKIDPAKECEETYEKVIPLPGEAARRSDIPFKWVGLNWNPHGHIPHGVYDLPHFDVHFYIAPIESVFAIGSGACGPEFVRCDQFKIATRPLRSDQMPAGYKNVGAVAPAMGNHLIDLTSPEFHKIKFTRAFIFGTYDGHLTFYEEMLTRAYLQSGPNECSAIKSPPAVAAKGYYPTQSCVRFLPESHQYTVSLEGFTLREGSAQVAASPKH